MPSPERPEDDEQSDSWSRGSRGDRSGPAKRERSSGGPRGSKGRGPKRSDDRPNKRSDDRPNKPSGRGRSDRARRDGADGRDRNEGRGRRDDRNEGRGRRDDRSSRPERGRGSYRERSDDRRPTERGGRQDRRPSNERGSSRHRSGGERGGRDRSDRDSRRERSYEPEEVEPTNRFDDGSGGERRTGPKKWGGVARRGAYHLGAREEDTSATFSSEEQAAYEERVARRAAEAERREGLRRQAADAIRRSESGTPTPRKRSANKKSFERQPLPTRVPEVDLAVALSRTLGEAEGKKAYRKVKRAATAFEDGRYDDARQILKPLVDAAPGVADVREIYGLTLYRMGRWRQAADQLEQFRVLAGSAEQNAVLADAYRAQQRWADVDALWEELRDQSPNGAAVNEGRVVVAGSLADRGMFKDAIALLEQGWTRPKRPREDHLSRAYALADLYDRAGEATVARELFAWVAGHDPMFSDAEERMRD